MKLLRELTEGGDITQEQENVIWEKVRINVREVSASNETLTHQPAGYFFLTMPVARVVHLQ